MKVATSAALTGTYANTSGAVSADIAGVGSSASDTLVVQPVVPSIAILKQVSTSTSGPWSPTVGVAPGGSVYYRLTIENTGDVPFSPVSVTDATLDISSCTWPGVLPVGSAAQDPTARCVVGPVAALSGSHSNTASAHGTYNGTVYNSLPKTAVYATTDLVLAKSVAESYFSAAGDLLHFSYLVTNTGAAALPGPVTVSDSNSTVTCPALSGVGNGDANLDQGESVTCTATYPTTALDVAIGSVTNTAQAFADGTASNIDRETVYMNQGDAVYLHGVREPERDLPLADAGAGGAGGSGGEGIVESGKQSQSDHLLCSTCRNVHS